MQIAIVMQHYSMKLQNRASTVRNSLGELPFNSISMHSISQATRRHTLVTHTTRCVK